MKISTEKDHFGLKRVFFNSVKKFRLSENLLALIKPA